MLARGKLCEVWRATVDTGAIPYFSRLPAIDIANVPLHNPSFVRESVEQALGRITEAAPSVIIVAGNREGLVALHPVREPLFEWARERDYRGAVKLQFDEDYFLNTYVELGLLQMLLDGGAFDRVGGR